MSLYDTTDQVRDEFQSNKMKLTPYRAQHHQKKKPTQKLKIKAKQTTKPNRNINFQYESSTLRNEYTPMKNEITIFFYHGVI